MGKFSEFLRQARKNKNMSIRQLSKYSGVSNAYISQIENGERDTPSPEILKKLAGPLGAPFEELMERAGHLDAAEDKKIDSHYSNDTDGLDLEDILNKAETGSPMWEGGPPMNKEDIEEFRVMIRMFIRSREQRAQK